MSSPSNKRSNKRITRRGRHGFVNAGFSDFAQAFAQDKEKSLTVSGGMETLAPFAAIMNGKNDRYKPKNAANTKRGKAMPARAKMNIAGPKGSMNTRSRISLASGILRELELQEQERLRERTHPLPPKAKQTARGKSPTRARSPKRAKTPKSPTSRSRLASPASQHAAMLRSRSKPHVHSPKSGGEEERSGTRGGDTRGHTSAGPGGTFFMDGRNSPTQPQPKRDQKNRTVDQGEQGVHVLNQPYRMSPPEYLKSPPRLTVPFIKRHRSPIESLALSADERKNQLLKRVRDFEQLASACRRAGRTRGAGHAYYCKGVIYDNMNRYSDSAREYLRFLEVCRKTNDPVGEALAHNSLGICYQVLYAENQSEEHRKRAMAHHNAHREIGDIAGRFMAHTNLGLVYAQCGDHSSAQEHHQHALRFAIRMTSNVGQSLAIGNLGLAAASREDFVTARACMERHLELSVTLADLNAQVAVLKHLGTIASRQHEYKESAQYFEEAFHCANEAGDLEAAGTAKAHIGATIAQQQLQDHMRELAQRMRQARDSKQE